MLADSFLEGLGVKRLIQTLICLAIVAAGGFVYENAQSKQLDVQATPALPKIPTAVTERLSEMGHPNATLDFHDEKLLGVVRYDFKDGPTTLSFDYSFRKGKILTATEWNK